MYRMPISTLWFASDALRQTNSSLMRQATTTLVGPRRLYSSARPESCKPPKEKVITAGEEGILHKVDKLDSVMEKQEIMLKEILRLVERRNMIRARCKLALLGASILGAAYYAKQRLFSGSQDQIGEANPSSLTHHQLDNTSVN